MQLTNDALFPVDSETGWVSGLRQLPSPNCDARPEGAQVEVIVLHGISLPAGQFGGDAVIRLFLDELDVNAHPSFCLLYTSPSPRDGLLSRMPSSG